MNQKPKRKGTWTAPLEPATDWEFHRNICPTSDKKPSRCRTKLACACEGKQSSTETSGKFCPNQKLWSWTCAWGSGSTMVGEVNQLWRQGPNSYQLRLVITALISSRLSINYWTMTLTMAITLFIWVLVSVQVTKLYHYRWSLFSTSKKTSNIIPMPIPFNHSDSYHHISYTVYRANQHVY